MQSGVCSLMLLLKLAAIYVCRKRKRIRKFTSRIILATFCYVTFTFSRVALDCVLLCCYFCYCFATFCYIPVYFLSFFFWFFFTFKVPLKGNLYKLLEISQDINVARCSCLLMFAIHLALLIHLYTKQRIQYKQIFNFVN